MGRPLSAVSVIWSQVGSDQQDETLQSAGPQTREPDGWPTLIVVPRRGSSPGGRTIQRGMGHPLSPSPGSGDWKAFSKPMSRPATETWFLAMNP